MESHARHSSSFTLYIRFKENRFLIFVDRLLIINLNIFWIIIIEVKCVIRWILYFEIDKSIILIHFSININCTIIKCCYLFLKK